MCKDAAATMHHNVVAFKLVELMSMVAGLYDDLYTGHRVVSELSLWMAQDGRRC